MEAEAPERPNPLSVRYALGRGYFVWSSFRERAISKDFDTKEEADRFLAGASRFS